ncbi:MAG: ABC transporter substrate-binding protein [Thermotogae bacterium]|nr:ABC transporter substrate-binding protein [Thermotogota bacterium]RKX52030.1 MAG: ABC transporter substrate-binding protein [Thermotoga sp.]
MEVSNSNFRRCREVRKFLVILFVLLFLFSLGVAKVKPIKLGAVLPLGDITGRQAANAMKLAVKEINEAGGVLGRPLELIIVDDEMKPEKGAAAINKLATIDKVDFFIGGMSSGVHLAQIPILKKYKKITVWIGAASHLCEQAIGPDADWYFHLHPWDYQQGASYAIGWKAILKKYPQVKFDRVFLAYEEGAFGTASYKAYLAMLEQAKKGKGVYVGLVKEFKGESFKSAAFGGGDYRAVLRHAKEWNPDVFIWAGYDADALPIVAQAKEIGFAPPIFIGAPPGWPADFGKSPLSEGIVLYGMWAPSLNKVSPVAEHFYNAYVKEFKEEPVTYFAPLGYTNVYFLVEGIKKAGTLEKEKLIKALEQVEYDSPLGEKLKIAPSAIIKHQGFTKQKILQWQNGKQEVIWPFEVQTADFIYPFPKWEDR